MESIENDYREILEYEMDEEFERLNLFDICNLNYSEDRISDWYAYFLNGSLEHNLGNLFLDSLIQLINKFDKYSHFSMDGCEVIREYQTNKKGYIDLVVYDGDEKNMNNSLIIESKINASIDNDLDDYYSSIEVSEDKIGILLTLNKLKKDYPDFINITHIEWVKEINKNINHYWLKSDEKYLLYLKDFLENIFYISKEIKMTDNIKFYSKNAKKINELLKLKNEAESFIAESLAQEINNTKNIFWERKNKESITLKFDNYNLKLYVNHTSIFDDKEFILHMWIKGKDLEKFTEVNRKLIEKEFSKYVEIEWVKEGRIWLQIAYKEYKNIDLAKIEEIGKYISKCIEDDFVKLANFIDKRIIK